MKPIPLTYSPVTTKDFSWIDNISVVDVIQRTGVKLTQSSGKLSGLCPLHNDKDTDSLKVYPETNSWCCFGGCQNPKHLGRRNGGGSVEFVQQRFSFTFPLAVKWLEENFKFNPNPVITKETEPPPKKEIKITENAILYWHSMLSFKHREWFYNRGFQDKIIDQEKWGWDGSRLIIPIWENKPSNSEVIAIKRRAYLKEDDGPKYIKKGYYSQVVWGKWYCLWKPTIFAFAGELDAALAVQDGLGAFSVTDGASSVNSLPKSWPHKWFENSVNLIVCFDVKEEVAAAKLAEQWENIKGYGTSAVFHYPPFNGKDYCDWRLTNSVQEFLKASLLYLTK